MAETIATVSHNEDLLELHRVELYRGTEAECERFLEKFHAKFNVEELLY